jgi:hypothetical protein
MRKNLLLLAAFSILLTLAYCAGKSQGAVTVEDKALAHRADSLDKLAKKETRRADTWHAKADSLDKKSSVVHTKYKTRRDTLVLTDTVQVKEVIELADSTIALKDSVIATQKKEIASLRQIVTWREDEISSLNKRLSLSTKRIRNARIQSWMQGFGVAAFAVVTVKALK